MFTFVSVYIFICVFTFCTRKKSVCKKKKAYYNRTKTQTHTHSHRKKNLEKWVEIVKKGNTNNTTQIVNFILRFNETNKKKSNNSEE